MVKRSLVPQPAHRSESPRAQFVSRETAFRLGPSSSSEFSHSRFYSADRRERGRPTCYHITPSEDKCISGANRGCRRNLRLHLSRSKSFQLGNNGDRLTPRPAAGPALHGALARNPDRGTPAQLHNQFDPEAAPWTAPWTRTLTTSRRTSP